MDPVFAGLHEWRESGEDTGNLSYSSCAHCVALPSGGDRWTTTIVLPPGPGRWQVSTIVHELGHALDYIDQTLHGGAWRATPVSKYAKSNRNEAFAEAFMSWVWGPQRLGSKVSYPEPATVAVFEKWAFI